MVLRLLLLLSKFILLTLFLKVLLLQFELFSAVFEALKLLFLLFLFSLLFLFLLLFLLFIIELLSTEAILTLPAWICVYALNLLLLEL